MNTLYPTKTAQKAILPAPHVYCLSVLSLMSILL